MGVSIADVMALNETRAGERTMKAQPTNVVVKDVVDGKTYTTVVYVPSYVSVCEQLKAQGFKNGSLYKLASN